MLPDSLNDEIAELMNSQKTNWNLWYTAVVVFLLLQILLYYLFTKSWS
jgi:hypothetical protein